MRIWKICLFFFSYINLRLAFHAARSLPLGERENEEKKKKKIKNVAVKFLRISEKCYFKSIKQEKKKKKEECCSKISTYKWKMLLQKH